MSDDPSADLFDQDLEDIGKDAVAARIEATSPKEYADRVGVSEADAEDYPENLTPGGVIEIGHWMQDAITKMDQIDQRDYGVPANDVGDWQNSFDYFANIAGDSVDLKPTRPNCCTTLERGADIAYVSQDYWHYIDCSHCEEEAFSQHSKETARY